MHTLTTALIATSPFVPTFSNGWHEEGPNRVLVAQPTVPLKDAGDYQLELETLWADFEAALPDIERVVVYFDLVDGIDELLQKLGNTDFESKQIFFVFCDCKMAQKMALLLKNGFGKSSRQLCDCGIGYMSNMYSSLLDEGMLYMAG